MTKRDKSILIEGLRKLSQDAADIAAALEGTEAQAKKPDEPASEPEPVKAEPPREGLHLRGSPGDSGGEVQDGLPGGGQGAAHRTRRKAAV